MVAAGAVALAASVIVALADLVMRGDPFLAHPGGHQPGPQLNQ